MSTYYKYLLHYVISADIRPGRVSQCPSECNHIAPHQVISSSLLVATNHYAV